MRDFSKLTYWEMGDVFMSYISAFTGYVEDNGNNQFVKYDDDAHILLFNNNGVWWNENEVEIDVLVNLANMLNVEVDLSWLDES